MDVQVSRETEQGDLRTVWEFRWTKQSYGSAYRIVLTRYAMETRKTRRHKWVTRVKKIMLATASRSRCKVYSIEDNGARRLLYETPAS